MSNRVSPAPSDVIEEIEKLGDLMKGYNDENDIEKELNFSSKIEENIHEYLQPLSYEEEAGRKTPFQEIDAKSAEYNLPESASNSELNNDDNTSVNIDKQHTTTSLRDNFDSFQTENLSANKSKTTSQTSDFTNSGANIINDVQKLDEKSNFNGNNIIKTETSKNGNEDLIENNGVVWFDQKADEKSHAALPPLADLARNEKGEVSQSDDWKQAGWDKTEGFLSESAQGMPHKHSSHTFSSESRKSPELSASNSNLVKPFGHSSKVTASSTDMGEAVIGANEAKGESGCCAIILTVLSYMLVVVFFPFSLCATIKVVQEYERAVIFRLGRLLPGGAKGPGIFFVMPCIEEYTKVDLRTVSFDVPPQEVLTRDSVTVSVDAVVYYRISNPTVSVANVENAANSTQLLAQTTLRNVLGTQNLAEILSNREHISDQMQGVLDDATDKWGIKVERVEIKDVRLPTQLQRAMAAEAEAARDARAKVIAAEGEQKASVALKEAADIIHNSPAALQLRYLQTLNSISAEKNSTIIFPLPIDVIGGFLSK